MDIRCIRCSQHCRIRVEGKDGKPTKITGNSCSKGKEYAEKQYRLYGAGEEEKWN